MSSKPYYDFLIVGAGFSGATLAERLASQGKTVLIIDKRPHIGGNCYDYIDKETGIRVSKYGPHFFHTNDKGVWNYVNSFGGWIRYDHKTVAKFGSINVPLPVNQETLNKIFKTHLNGSQEVKDFLASKQIPLPDKQEPKNSEEVALQRVGRGLYEALFRPYTLKQWAKDPSQLDASVLARIPVRDDNDCRYFTDRYQGLPEEGYTSIFKKMLFSSKITSLLDIDYTKVKDMFEYGQVIFTGRIDSYFSDSGLPLLEYRSLIFEHRRYECDGFKQQNSVVNYPSADTPYTRSVEYKWFPNCPVTPLSASNSIVVYETSCDYDPTGTEEPYYPVPAPRNQELYEKYKALASQTNTGTQKVHFIGRLASYKYFNMDQAIRASLDYFKEHFANNETKCIY